MEEIPDFDTNNRVIMKLAFLPLFVFLLSFSFAQQKGLEFAIYFGNDFNNDSVTIIANGVTIANNIQLKITMISPQNLIIIQDRQHLTVSPHYEQKQTLKKISIKNSILNLTITLSSIRRTFRFNLKEGRFFYPEFKSAVTGKSNVKELFITQSKRGPIML